MTFGIHDSPGFVPSGDVAALKAEGSSWPFDVHLLVENASSFDALENDAHNAVTAPNVMAIAIDPQLHKTVVRFGTGTGVKAGDYDSIAKAGNAHLRAGEVKQAIDAIVTRAVASRQATTAISASSEPVVLHQGLSGGEWFLLILIAAAGCGFVYWLWRRWVRSQEAFARALDDNRLETAELRSHNANEAAWEAKIGETTRPAANSVAPRAAAPVRRTATRPTVVASPVVVQPVAPAVVVAPQNDRFVEGMLIGDMLSNRPERETRIVEREVVRESPRSNDDGGSSSGWGSGSSSDYSTPSTSSDSGGSSSSWDSGGSSSSDSGSSSWDSGSSGGGFDSGGGGGFDGGGGGGDW